MKSAPPSFQNPVEFPALLHFSQHNHYYRHVCVQLSVLLSELILDMKHDATDRFMGDIIGDCHCSQRFLLLHHTMNDYRPVFSRKTVFRVFWPWTPFTNNRRRAGIRSITVSEHLLDLERQSACRGQEEGKNW